MYLKRMTMYGFKSFATETVIEFPRGITALVGPNGGGKSNVVDALRWALGEQRPRELRAERWPDILFSGEGGLLPARLAEVVLTFDEANSHDPDWPDTLTVTRRYYRNGESEYLLNGRVVRLKDVTDLFLDSGLGRSNYAIISQGGVESALLLKPKERLEQLEESSGVSRYRLRRRETVQHLAEVEVKLTRLRDLIAEVALEADGVKRRAQVEERLDQLSARANELSAEVRRTRFAIDEAEVIRLTAECAAEEQEAGRIRGEIFKREQKQRELDEEDRQLRGQWSSLREALEAATQSVSEAETGLVKAEAIIAGYERELESLLTRADQLSQWIADSNTSVVEPMGPVEEESFFARARHFKSELEEIQRRLREHLDQREPLAAQLAALDQALLELGQAKSRFQAWLGVDDSDRLNERWRQRVIDHQRQAEEMLSLGRDRDRFLAVRADIESRQRVLQTQFRKLEQNWALASTEWQARARTSQTGPGLSPGVRAVLAQANQGGILAPRGILGSLIETEPEFRDALAVALGGGHQDLVVDREEDARRWVEWLKTGQRGRATFLPLDILSVRELSSADLGYAEMPGAVGWAANLVRFEQDLKPAVYHVLGRVLVVERLEDATRIGRIHRFRFRTVTLDGQVVLVGGAITGGQRPSIGDGSGKEIGRLKSALDRIQAEKDECQRELETVQAQLKQVSADLEQTSQRLVQRKTAWQHDEALIATLSQQDDPGTLAERERLLVAERTALKAAIVEHDRSSETLQSAINAKEQEIAQVTTRQAEHQGKAALQQAMQARDAAERERWQVELEGIEERVQKLSHLRDSHKAEAQTWRMEAETRRERRAAIAHDFEMISSRQEGLGADRRGLAEQTRSLEQQLANGEGRLTQRRRQLDMITLRWESSPLEDFEKALEPMNAKQLAQAERELKRLRVEIAEIGPVDRGSLSRWRDLNKRQEDLGAEEEDVKAAKVELESTLAELDELVNSRVRETADRVEAAFRQACETLFGGGSATFRWTNDDEPGVDLFVAPPGKRPARLNLLSGGEKALGGLAWLFSLLSIRRAPFVVLDEVEASLDEMNAERFGRYLADRGAESQFIVITHHKATMEAAAALWGVSGNGRGQSRVVSVLLEPPHATFG